MQREKKIIKVEEIIDWIKEKVLSAHAKGVVFGLSGGLDSAVVGALCIRAFPNRTLGLIMPCLSAQQDITDAELVASVFRIPVRLIDLRPVFENFVSLLKTVTKENKNGSTESSEPDEKVTLGNLKARLRMCTLYYFANKYNYLVVGTGNKSELMMGYFTKYGDGAADLLPLGNFTKTEVYQLADELGVPERIIKKAPSAGLWDSQTDEAELGIKYIDLDKILLALERNEENLNTLDLDKKLVEKVKSTIVKTQHKRTTPPIYYPSLE